MFIHVRCVGQLGKVVGPNGLVTASACTLQGIAHIQSSLSVVSGRASDARDHGAFSSQYWHPHPRRTLSLNPNRRNPHQRATHLVWWLLHISASFLLGIPTPTTCKRRSPARSPHATASTRATPRACATLQEHEHEHHGCTSRTTHGRDLSSSSSRLSWSGSETWPAVGSSVSGDFSRTRGRGSTAIF